VLVAHRADARAGGRDDNLVLLGHLGVVADQRQGLVEVAGIDVHLPATGLRGGEVHFVAEPLQQQHRGFGRFGEQRVGQAGREQCNAHGRLRR